MHLTKNWIHAVWSVNELKPLLTEAVRNELFLFLKQEVSGKYFTIDCINGTDDHLHCIALLPAETSVAKLIFVLREQSKHFINKNNLLINKLMWSDDYIAVSVSESMLDKMREYVKMQKEIHQSKSYITELNEFTERYKFGT